MSVKKQSKYIAWGFVAALVLNFLGGLAYIIFFNKYGITKTWAMIQQTGLYGQVLALVRYRICCYLWCV